MTYYEVLKKVRETELEAFINEIRNKEIEMKNDNVDEFINSLRTLFEGYEAWFENKKGRNRKPKKDHESIYIN